MTFVDDRRDPTDRRSWRQAPVFVGDVAAHVDRPQWLMVVTGVLPRRHVEVVTWARVRDALGTFRGLDDVQEALRDGRLVGHAMPRRELSPVTEGVLDAVVNDARGAEEVAG